MCAALTLQGVSKRYGSYDALNNITLSIEEGEFFALLGPNGAGKTTLIHTVAGLIRQDAGHISVMGYDTVRAPYQAKMQLGVVPQELVFDPFLTVFETLRFQSGYYGLKRNDDWIEELLTRLGLADRAHHNMRMLSGGMKRRVMVAQALVHKPPVIVLDEPTAGVDIELRQSLWSFIRELNAANHTVVLTTHYFEEAETQCRRIAMLKKGSLVALDTKEALLSYTKGRELALALSAPLPDRLRPFWLRTEGSYEILALDHIKQLEDVFTCLREYNIEIFELTIVRSSLESTFVKIINGASA